MIGGSIFFRQPHFGAFAIVTEHCDSDVNRGVSRCCEERSGVKVRQLLHRHEGFFLLFLPTRSCL